MRAQSYIPFISLFYNVFKNKGRSESSKSLSQTKQRVPAKESSLNNLIPSDTYIFVHMCRPKQMPESTAYIKRLIWT